jgi:pyruvate/2-oxoglutarate dehydrogenase complex dihydrolipoamide dehydrogenase (E3) component
VVTYSVVSDCSCDDITGTTAVKAFELECAQTGLSDHEWVEEAGFNPVSETVTASLHSRYYPGATETTVTLTADRETGRLLGGSIIGTDRAAIRINTLATALDRNMSVLELERLAYTPPFSRSGTSPRRIKSAERNAF